MRTLVGPRHLQLPLRSITGLAPRLPVLIRSFILQPCQLLSRGFCLMHPQQREFDIPCCVLLGAYLLMTLMALLTLTDTDLVTLTVTS